MAFLVNDRPPCVLFEDDHLLVVHKPAGLNTHSPAPYAGEGLYDWLRHREPRWASLAIMHRLDKETSGVLLFTKTPLANRSLTEQFAGRSVRKRYQFLTDQRPPDGEFTVQSRLVRDGERYIPCQNPSVPQAETRFRVIESGPGLRTLLEAQPLTGRTHQIRAQAAHRGFPILGDTLYGGASAERLCLHAAELTIRHPETGSELSFRAAPDFSLDVRTALREALWPQNSTTCYRLCHGAADRAPGYYLDRVGAFLLSSSQEADPGSVADHAGLARWSERYSARSLYHKQLRRDPGRAGGGAPSPRWLAGEPAPETFEVLENGLRFQLSFAEGYSIGLFLDQRDNRRRLLTGHVAANFPLFSSATSQAQVLNVFAYTCAFSVCAAQAGCQTTSLDLSKRYLEWGERNFALNALDPKAHDFIYGDALDWMERLARKRRLFDLILLDPPTFSRSKQHGIFQVEKDYDRLVALALPLLKPGAVLFASTNASTLPVEAFLHVIQGAVRAGHRTIGKQHYVPQPPDFPICRDEPGYLKTFWLRLN